MATSGFFFPAPSPSFPASNLSSFSLLYQVYLVGGLWSARTGLHFLVSFHSKEQIHSWENVVINFSQLKSNSKEKHDFVDVVVAQRKKETHVW